MRPIAVIFVAFALVAAGLAAYLAKVWLDSRAPQVVVQEAPAPKPTGMVQILVAARQIEVGTKLTDADVRWAEWPKTAIEDRFIEETEIAKAAPAVEGQPVDKPATPIAKAEDAQAANIGVVIFGSIARRRILTGEPIGLESIIQPGDRSVVAAVLDPGMRAISIPISADSAAAGFINPGDYVDILLASNVRSQVGEGSENKKSDVIINWATETVMHNVKVLAIDQKLAHDSKEGPAVVGRSATLEVTPADAERLLAAQQLGSLSLVLRSMVQEEQKDQTAGEPTLDTSFQDPMLFTADKEVSKGLAALAGATKSVGPTGGFKVRVNRGGSLTVQSFQ